MIHSSLGLGEGFEHEDTLGLGGGVTPEA